MTGLSCLTFVLVAFCCYTMSMSKPTRKEAAKKVELPHEQQQQQPHHPQLQSEATYETRQKRSQLDLGNIGGGTNGFGNTEYKDFNEFMEELGDNAIMPVSQEMDLENMPPLLYFMLLQKLKQLQTNERQLPTRRTPRLGRSIDFQLFDAGAATTTGHDFDGALNMANDYAVSRQYLPRVMKKSVQFKPRLGKRTQVCD
ncbi:Protein hugin [Lucilia cuprina]|uniref:Protein hugin n=1 Tax=Lucilia cuprina TaxID=7375 RepID=A0A0L0BYE3_LUCCU|nr:Protein hugin [Lucilia cuprina]KNC24991.1 Protein hugin [Lucilia cuprina]